MGETADLEATAEIEATAGQETAAAEGHRTDTGVHHTQVDGVLLHRHLADHMVQMDHRAPLVLNHPPTTRERGAEAADAIDIA